MLLALVVVLDSCESTEEAKPDRRELSIDHLTQVKNKELRNRIKSLDREMRDAFGNHDNALQEIEVNRERFDEQRQVAVQIVADKKQNTTLLLRKILELDSLLIAQRNQFLDFKDRSIQQLRMVQLGREIDKVKRDLDILKKQTVNEIEVNAIKFRYSRIWQEISVKKRNPNDEQQDLAKGSYKPLINMLMIWQDTLEARLNKQAYEFEQEMDRLQRAIVQDSTTIVSLKKEIKKLDADIAKTAQLIDLWQKNFARDSTIYRKKADDYQEKGKWLWAKKISHEIALLEQEFSSIDAPKEVHDIMRETRQLHAVLLDNLFKYDYDLVQEQINVIEGKLKELQLRRDEIDKLVEVVRNLFRNTVFKEYLTIGSTTPENLPEFKQNIEAFKATMPIIRQFLELYPKHKIFIDGYADPLLIPDNPLYGNKILSKQRAESAKLRLVNAGIADSNIVVDWFGEFHSQVNPDSIGPEGSPKDRRIDMRVIGPKDTTKAERDYRNFRKNYEVKIGKTTKRFYHSQGYWIEKYPGKAPTDSIFIKYKGSVYNQLLQLQRYPLFRSLMERRASPIFKGGALQLGNEVKVVLPFGDKEYWVVIRDDAAETLDDPRVGPIASYLR